MEDQTIKNIDKSSNSTLVYDNTSNAYAPSHEDGSGDHGDDHGETPAI